MPVIIRFEGFASGAPGPQGQYVESFDHEAYNGQGHGVFTTDPAKAMRFANHDAAFTFWRRTSKVRPQRPDGKPNRPLTACHVSFEPVESTDDDNPQK